MTEENRNLILAFSLSMLVLFGWFYFVDRPRMEAEQTKLQTMPQTPDPASHPISGLPNSSGIPQPGTAPANLTPAPAAEAAGAVVGRADMLARAPRIHIVNGQVHGSISLQGGRLDDLTLATYRETVSPDSPEIVLLSPAGTAEPYYAEYGFVASDGAKVPVPDNQTLWSGDVTQVLRPGAPVTMHWDNGAGLKFTRVYEVDAHYLFTITEKVENSGAAPVSLMPYGLVSRHYTPQVSGYYILHEGMLGVLDGTLNEITYEKIRKAPSAKINSKGGWLGITDKYWLVSLIPDQQADFTGSFSYTPLGARDRYQTDYLRSAVTIAPGQSTEITSRLFAGAKKVSLIDTYADKYSITLFDRTIDWGWFYFLTKPLFVVIDWFYGLTGNFGIAIILLTVSVKAAFFPLANKSYVAMSRMKKLQPLMLEIREKFADDKARQQQEMMDLYKREKANPLSGCLPMLVQIPVFFSLYKVLFVTIEMRHSPFFGWINDLAAPDPTTLFNLLGLIPWTPPGFLMIGLWPIMMGVSMWMQQRLNPAPADPVQEKVFMWMPVFFTFLLGTFPAGLVIYWTVNNLLSILQQSVIMKREGAEISFRW
ncbi:MAG: membrane protein insertase YidC [Alphaproteobacteria bacterium]|nr:membrane protein insertase YidC [Alphaproteobacteria bacterium]